MTASPAVVRTTARVAAVVSGVLLSSALSAAPAAAAAPSEGPDDRASCVGQVFVPQATGDPGQVADRIHEIMEIELPEYGVNFGTAISRGLAHETFCQEEPRPAPRR